MDIGDFCLYAEQHGLAERNELDEFGCDCGLLAAGGQALPTTLRSWLACFRAWQGARP